MYFQIKHFHEQDKAEKLFKKICADHNLKEKAEKSYWKYADNGKFWMALDDRTNNTLTLIADLPDESEDFFTIFEYDEDALDFYFKILDSDLRRFELEYKKEDQQKFSNFLGSFKQFSNSNFLINTFYERVIDAYNGIENLDKKIGKEYNWRIPKEIDDKFLSDLESYLDDCGNYYSSMESNYLYAKTELKNIETHVKQYEEKYGVNIKINDFQRLIDEMEVKVASSKIVFKRIGNMKDIVIGKESIKNQEYALTLQRSTIILEIFVFYASSIAIWNYANPVGFTQMPLLLKYVIPMFVAVGVVLLVESIKDFKIYKYLIPLKVPAIWRSLIFIILALILIIIGFFLISIKWG